MAEKVAFGGDYRMVKISFNFLGNPCIASKANGAAQFAQRSMKSQIGSPAIGRLNAVTKAHNVAQIKTIRTGKISAKKAITISVVPIRGSSVVAVASEKPNEVISSIQLCFTPSAKIPCPKKDPNMPMRKIHSAVFVS